MGFINRLLGGEYNEKELKKVWPIVDEVNELAEDMARLTDEELAELSTDYRERLAGGEPLDDILPEAFAAVREVSERRIGLRPFDVQILGGIVLHQGKISEMKTGEGKTLVATLPLYLNGLAGHGAHLVTVNDYLAKRDAQWMGPIYHSLGLSVGVLQHDTAYVYDPTANLDNASLRYLRPATRREAYGADITYGTNNEFGFDYLRDNMVQDLSQAVQREDTPHTYAIVDEVDSILIDEARTPLIISGPAEETEEVYRTFARIVPRLEQEIDYIVDIKHKSVSLTDEGSSKVEKAIGIKNLYDPENFRLTRFVDAALKAHALYHLDQQYVVKDGEVIIVDEFTGRLMYGRRWSDGLHQAVEAKEGVKVQRESVTYATITLQNYFRLYQKLAGMTGTAWTEREEFHQIYGLDVLMIPTAKDMIRADNSDIIFRSEEGKFHAVVYEIEQEHALGRPSLVGTVSIENSEKLADMLKRLSRCELKDCAEHHAVCPLKEPQVLNAKQHEREAYIVAQAGVYGAVTIATNMAGRGTDIILGGNPDRLAEDMARKRGLDIMSVSEGEAAKIRSEVRDLWQVEHDRVVAAGGLHIIGTERHEARRIDNQLRGRSSRQGDPGSSRFYLSLEDPLLRIFAGERVNAIMQRLGMPEGEPIEHSLVTRSIESAQRKVEAHNFDIRKQLLEYDNVANDQRREIYQLRNSILESQDVSDQIAALREGVVTDFFRAHVPEESMEEQWDIPGLEKVYAAELRLDLPLSKWLESDPSLDDDALLKRAIDEAHAAYARKMAANPPEAVHQFERLILLSTLDNHWLEHLAALDHLRQGIHLRGYAQKNPKQEYKREAFELFGNLVESVKLEVTRTLMTVELRNREQVEQVERVAPAIENVQYQHAGYEEALAGAGPDAAPASKPAPFVRQMGKIGRNDPCPCGSGKKYKHCHGKLA